MSRRDITVFKYLMEKMNHTPATNLGQKYSALPAKTKAGIIASVAAIIAGLLIYSYLIKPYLTKPELKKTADATAVAGTFRPTKAQLEALKIMPVQAISFRSEQITDGNIANNEDSTTPVYSPYSGHVSKLFAKLGDVVTKGAPLMAVEATEFVQGQNDLITAVANVKSTQAQFNLAQLAEQRQHELLNARAGAQKDWLQSQSDLATAEGNFRSAEIALGAVRNRLKILGKSEQEISVLENASGNKTMNAEAIVRSPINGTVILRQIGLGQNIQSATGGATTPVYAIANLSTVWMIANVRETDAPLIKVGAPIEVSVLAVPGRIFKAKLSWIAPSIDPNTHRLAVRADIDNHDGVLKPAMFATFHIVTSETSVAASVPQSAIVYESADAHVFVIDKDSNIMLRAIHTGRINNDLVEVTSGLKVGEKIVTSGALFIDRVLQDN